ncbi:MAG: NTP transferase domain-containing protein [Parvibaculaceae bacterium]
MKFGEVRVEEAEGAILAHSVRHAKGVFRKGRLLTAADVALLTASDIARVFAARIEPDDMREDEAAEAVAQPLAGRGALVQAPFTGRANLHAAMAGVALVDAERVKALNRLHESLTVATVPAFETVAERQMLATVKIIPFAAPRSVIQRALELIGDRPLVSVAAFSAHRAGLVITKLPQTKPSLIAKSEAAVRERLAALGSTLGDVVVTRHDAAGIGKGVAALSASGHDPILVFGASAIVDRGDVVPQGVVAAGGEVRHLGMPVDPGNLLMLARIGKTPVIGVPSCARSPKVNGFDWVLARTLAGLDPGPEDIMDMGAGGLLTEIPSRPSPRERNEAASGFAPRIATVVLAAGLSRRMQGRNKLLEPVGGMPMVRRTVENALRSQARPVLVVTGHEADAIAAALAGLEVTFVHNADYASGLASSLKAGIAAVPADCDGAVICLGDMPFVGPGEIDRLIAAFNPGEGRLVCVPVRAGRQGNPVLWPRTLFPELLSLDGDRGAKDLLQAHEPSVVEVPMPSDAVLSDFDTLEALASLREASAP